MGSGISRVCHAAGYKVTLIDPSQEQLNKVKLNCNLSQDPMEIKNADFAIECIVEDIEKKHKLLTILDENAPNHTIFATNTSSLRITDISSCLSSSRREKFIGLHFFNPVPSMKLVELIPALASQETRTKVHEFTKTINKTVIECKDTPGFVVNRLLVPYILESIHLVERGESTMKEVDVAMKLGAGYPMGPFELADYVGLDTLLFIAMNWEKELKGMYKVPELLKKLVSQNKLGKKTKIGFYEYK